MMFLPWGKDLHEIPCLGFHGVQASRPYRLYSSRYEQEGPVVPGFCDLCLRAMRIVIVIAFVIVFVFVFVFVSFYDHTGP